MPMSNITLAFAEATGWYMPNYDMAELLVWGKNSGCGIIDSPCLSGSPLTAVSKEFCASTFDKGCNIEYSASGYCYVHSGTVTNAAWNYWGNGTVSNDDYVDNCPTWYGYANRLCGPGGTTGYAGPE